MAEITLGGSPIHTSGELPAVGSVAPPFTLTGADFGAISSADLTGQRVVLKVLDDYGVRITDGKLEGLAARAVVVIGEDGTVVHRELVPEIAQEPDYDAAVAALG